MRDLLARFGWYIAGAVLILIVAGWLLWNYDPFGRRKAAEVRASNAEAQSSVDSAATKALDTYVTKTIVIRERADAAVQSVQQAPGAAEAINPDRRALLCAELASVRGRAVCTDDLRAAGPEGTVQGADDTVADPG